MLQDLDFSTEEGARVYRHSTSHVLAQAVKRLYPGARLGIGRYRRVSHDFEFESPFRRRISENRAGNEKIIAELPFGGASSTGEGARFYEERDEP